MSPDVLRIFVSSPGDVGEERVMTERVVQRLQGWFGQSIKLEPIIWEHEPMRATQHPQEQIPLPSQCDIVVCLLWSRLGTRLPEKISSAGKTGTEWEFEDAARSFREKGLPDLLVYRKTKEVLASVDDDLTYQEKKHQRNALNGFLTHWFKSEDGTFKAVFKTFEALDQFEDLLERDLRKLIQERLKLAPVGEITWPHAPFRGLEVFDYEHAPIFFGRTRALGAIREALVQQAAHGCAFVLVFGMSGVGKSSLVRAGVLPTITQPGVIEGVGLWRWCVFRPSDAPGDLCDGLASVLMVPPALPELAEAGVDGRALAKLLREAPEQAALPMSVGLKRAAETTAAAEHLLKAPVTRLALVVDQMEELFASERVNEHQRIGFVKALSALARSGHVWIIGTMRSDFYPRCADLAELAAMKAGAGQFDLLPPTAPELAQMIDYPARAAGLRFEDKATGERLNHVLQETALRDPQALPLLEFTLAELYQLCSRDNPPGEPVVLTFAAYEQLGGMEGALARRAEEEFARLSPKVQAALPAVFRALVTVRHGEEEALVTQPALREVFATAPDQEALVEAFIQARLFVSDRTSAEEKALVRLAHEALLRCWPRLIQWLTDNREFLRIRARVSEEAKRWQSEGRLPELLLHKGKPLAEGEFLLKQQKQELDPDVVEYIELSRHSAARARRWRRVAVTAFVLSLVIGMVVSSFFAWQSNKNANKADERRRKAETLTVQLKFEQAFQQPEENRALSILNAAGLLGEAVVLENQPLQDSLRLHLGSWFQEVHRLKSVFSYTGQAVAFSPDGKTMLTGSDDQTARLWEIATGKEFGPPLHHQSSVNAVAFTSDGKTVLTASEDRTARLWEASTGKLLGPPLQLEGIVNAVACSRDGRSVLTGSDSGARLWETATGTPLGPTLRHDWEDEVRRMGKKTAAEIGAAKIRHEMERHGLVFPGQKKSKRPSLFTGVLAVAFSSDSKTVLTASEDRTARLWEAPTGKPLGPLLKHQDQVSAAIFSPDAKMVMTGSFDKTARLWDAATGKQLGAPLEHFGWVSAVAFSPDGTTVVTGSFDKTARLWETATGKPLGPPLWHQDAVLAVAFSSGGGTVLTGSGNVLLGKGEGRLWETATGKPLGPLLQHEDRVLRVAFSSDGQTAVTGSFDKTARLWETATGKPLGSPSQDLGAQPVAFSPDGKSVLTGGGRTAILWKAPTDKLRVFSLLGFLEHQGDVKAGAFSPDGKTMLTGSDDKTARLWDAATGKPLGSPMQHQGTVVAVAFSPDGKTVLTGSSDKTARLWEAATGKPLGSPLQHQNEVVAVAFSPDGKTVLTGSRDMTAQLWDAVLGKPLGRPLRHQGGVNSVAFSPDSTTVLTGSWDKTARLWEAATGKQLGSPLQHQNEVVAVAFSPDGKTVLTGSRDKTAQLWDAVLGKPLGRPLRHQGGVNSVAFSPDSKTVLTGSDDQTARLWHVPRPIQGTPERILLWAQVITGLELDEHGGTRGLDAATWKLRRQRLQELGGPPGEKK